MATGRVLQFDKERGYGFIAADDGGEDVFLHASVYEGDSYELSPGMRVEFKVMAGDRGRKAFAVRSIPDESDSVGNSVMSPEPVRTAQAELHEDAPKAALIPEDEPMCDVLSREELAQELTEILLASAPTLAGQQILQVRGSMLECARKHGWIDV